MTLQLPLLVVLRIRIGLQPDDDSKDLLIEQAYMAALAMCETFCDRWFEFKVGQVEQFGPTRTRSLLLRRYPVLQVTSIVTGMGESLPLTNYSLLQEAGIVMGVAPWLVTWTAPVPGIWMPGDPAYTVTYDGGFDPLPPDLSLAVALGFDAVWYATPGAGALPGQANLPVKSVSVVGVGSMDFDASGSGSGSGHTDGASGSWSLLPQMATDILQRYKHASVIAGA